MVPEENNENMVGKRVCQTVIITYLEVPKDKPPVEKIYSLASSIDKEIKFKTSKDKVIVQGKIELLTMYKQVDDLEEIIMQQLDHSIDFDYILSIPGVEAGMSTQVQTEIEYINYSLVDQRNIELEIIFRITATVGR